MSDYDGRKMFAKIGSAPVKRAYQEAIGVIKSDGRRIATLEAQLEELTGHLRAALGAQKSLEDRLRRVREAVYKLPIADSREARMALDGE